MEIELRGGLPFVKAQLTFQGRLIEIDSVLIDTGSAGSVFQADRLLDAAVEYEPTDVIREIRGVGGTEFVFTKRVDELRLGEFCVEDFQVEVGAMDYGFDIEGIVGMNFLLEVGAIIDLDSLVIR